MNLRFPCSLFAALLLALLGTSQYVRAEVPAGAPGAIVQSLHVGDIEGREHVIPDLTAPATVLIFIAHDCPISCAMLPEIERIRKAYPKTPFYVIYAEPQYSDGQARAHAKQYAIGSTCIYDHWMDLVTAYDASVTPEAVVVSRSRRILYEGRIDDKFAALGTYRAEATTHELRDALAEITQGQRVTVANTRAVGCTIEIMLMRGNG